MAEHYYSQEDYYSQEKGPAVPEFFGELRGDLNLKPDFNSFIFNSLMNGLAPDGSQIRDKKNQLCPKRLKKKVPEFLNQVKKADPNLSSFYKQVWESKFSGKKVNVGHIRNFFLNEVDRIGKNKPEVAKLIGQLIDNSTQLKQRAGIDLTFSAPKSVSIMSLVYGDKELINAHKEAVKYTLKYVEDNLIGARVGGRKNRKFEKTGNLVATIFNHGTSRLGDPLIHSHCLIMNATKTSEGNFRAIHNDIIFKNSVLLGTIYQKKLADLCMEMGYGINIKPNGTFEIKGISQGLIDLFSKRSHQLSEITHGLGSVGAKEKRELIRKSRNKKELTHSQELKIKWEKESSPYSIPADIKLNKLVNNPVDWNFAANHLSENKSVWSKESLLLEGLKANLDRSSVDFIIKNINQKSGLVSINGGKESESFTTADVLNTEFNILKLFKNGNDKFSPIDLEVNPLTVKRNTGFNDDQLSAFELTMKSNNQVIIWSGVAGSGKSYALNEVRLKAEKQGCNVMALAPDGSTAKSLGESIKSKSMTLDKFLLKNTKKLKRTKSLLIVDEAGKLSSKKMLKLLEFAEKNNARVLLTGDERQFGAIEAGNPFSLMIKNSSSEIAILNEHRRQRKNTELKKIVEFAASRDGIKKSVELLDPHIVERKTDTIRLEKMAKEYLNLSKEERENTLLLADVHKDRNKLIENLRTVLKKTGELHGPENSLKVLKSIDLTTSEKSKTYNFEIDQIIIPFKNHRGLKTNEEYKIIEVLEAKNSLILGKNGQKTELNLSKFDGFSAYKQSEIKICVGDKLQRTKNAYGFLNKEEAKIEKIKDDKVYFEGVKDPVSLSQNHFLEHNLVSTTYLSQGRTVKNVFYLAQHNVSRESWYVALSRAEKNVKIFTDNKEKLIQNVGKSKTQENALDKVCQYEKPLELKLEPLK